MRSEPVVEEFPDYILINGQRMRKPLVEKPMDADDHSVIMYRRHSHTRIDTTACHSRPPVASSMLTPTH